VPTPEARLTLDAARAAVDAGCFAPAGPGRVGLECEFFLYAVDDPAAPPDQAAVGATLGGLHLPHGSTITFEPGGQLELSTPPLANVGAAATALAADLAVVEAALADAGLVPAGVGLDPIRSAHRVVTAPRYDAMEAFFDRDSEAGRRMMCSTASIQVNLDIGSAVDAEARWRLAHAVSPVLAAAFANSALAGGRPTGRRSSRLATWWAIDPTRTAPVTPSTRQAWVDYVMAARVMLVRADEHCYTPVDGGLTFEQWVSHGHPLGYPTLDDLDYHIGTLFPPVRPRGRLELRVVDALPAPWWRVAAAVATALLDDPVAAATAADATASTAGLWREAADVALGHPLLAGAAARCFDAALDALPRIGADDETVTATERFVEQYVARGRCPADDQLQTWLVAPTGSAVPWN
jgi:glutamate--cysteine ligase